ncbi:hypothetical protein RUND412_010180 [Rhizina undulata]
MADSPSSNPARAGSETHSRRKNSSSSSSSSSPIILYNPPTVISLLRSTAINLILPFINGLMLGFGELFAHEIAFRLGWSGTRVFPASRATRTHPLGPGIEARETGTRSKSSEDELRNLASLE